MKNYLKIFVINPGSTSTKIAMFENETPVFTKSITHQPEKLKSFHGIIDQLDYRKQTILNTLKEENITLSDVDAFAGRGGSVYECESGTYPVNEKMIEDLKVGVNGQHPASLGGLIADSFAKEYGKGAYIVDPPCVDELDNIARVSGLKDIRRRSRNHTLNQKEAARRAALELGKPYEETMLVVAHLGGGISVAAHKKGRIVDVADCLYGDGPLAPNRAGELPAGDVVEMCFSGKYDKQEMMALITKKGGFIDHLGTDDLREVNKRIAGGDKYAELIYNAMIYQIGKEIGSYATVLHGKVDAVVLTGGMTRDELLIEKLKEMAGYIAPVKVFPGEFELEALAHGVLRVLTKKAQEKEYKGKTIPDELI